MTHTNHIFIQEKKMERENVTSSMLLHCLQTYRYMHIRDLSGKMCISELKCVLKCVFTVFTFKVQRKCSVCVCKTNRVGIYEAMHWRKNLADDASECHSCVNTDPKLPHRTKALGLGHNSTIVWCISTIVMPWMRIAGIQQQLYHKPLSQNKNNWCYDNGNGNKVVFSCTPPVSFQHTTSSAHSQNLIHKHQSMFSTCCS